MATYARCALIYWYPDVLTLRKWASGHVWHDQQQSRLGIGFRAWPLPHCWEHTDPVYARRSTFGLNQLITMSSPAATETRAQ